MNRQDLQAVADLTTEALRVSPVAVAQITRRRGFARVSSRTVSIPLWAMEAHDAYAIYYTVHEVCHHVVGMGHDSRFRWTESQALALWGLRIERKRIYAKTVLTLDGKRLCGEYGKPQLPSRA